MRISESAKIDKLDAVPESGGRFMRKRDGNRGLADAAWAAEGHEAALGQVLGKHDDRRITPDEPARPGRKPLSPLIGRQITRIRSHRHRRVVNRSDETIPAAGNVDHVGLATLAVIQSAAQLDDMEAQAALVDRQAGPSPRDKVGFADDFAGTVNQQTEIVRGLKQGEPVVTQGAFHLKSILAGGELGED